MKRSACSRRGLSLFEVVLCMALLAISLSILGQLLNAAQRGATRATRETEAIVLAESLLAEIVSAGTAPAAVSAAPLGEDDAWTYSLEVESTEWTTLLSLTLTVQHRNVQEMIDAEVSLTRWLYLPDTSEEEQAL